MLDDRVFTSVDRESCMARIWDAYGVVTDYLSSNAPADLDSPERSFYGDMLGDMGAVHGNATDCEGDWHGCEGQATVDLDYYGDHQ
jgi:hypothetical protein